LTFKESAKQSSKGFLHLNCNHVLEAIKDHQRLVEHGLAASLIKPAKPNHKGFVLLFSKSSALIYEAVVDRHSGTCLSNSNDKTPVLGSPRERLNKLLALRWTQMGEPSLLEQHQYQVLLRSIRREKKLVAVHLIELMLDEVTEELEAS
tara:strand:+ start:529 stop:975 length:447 start_codon:yes stop_codon:yes gene_type:complete